jgi:hypothetical protein
LNITKDGPAWIEGNVGGIQPEPDTVGKNQLRLSFRTGIGSPNVHPAKPGGVSFPFLTF